MSRRSRFAVVATVVSLLLAVPSPCPAATTQPAPGGFGAAEPVRIVGYEGDAMEPFITRDGRYLIFNSRNDPPERTDLFFAERIDGKTFRFRGPLAGANSPQLDAVASVDCAGVMYFVSNRSFASTFSTIYRARFRRGVVSHVELAPGISQHRPNAVNFDAEISPDGETLFIVESEFAPVVGPRSARIAIYRRRGGGFERDARSDALMAAIDTAPLQYAPSNSADGREIFFTRPAADGFKQPEIFHSVRRDNRHPFGPPERLTQAQGFVEAVSLSLDGRVAYYHALRNGRFVIERLTRPAAAATGPVLTCAQIQQRARALR